MAHNRTEIRAAVKALIDAIPSPVAANVYLERRRRIDSTLRPCIIISTGEDDQDPAERAMGGPYQVEHTQSLLIELHADGDEGDTAADTIDAMELQVEAALASDLELGGLCELLTPVASTLEMSADTDRVTAVRGVTYSVAWRSAFGTPDTPES